MSYAGQGTAGKTRTCPHCKATILQSASICPICTKSLRFDPHTARSRLPTFSALRVEGAIRQPASEQPWEYQVMVSVRNDRGEELSRHMVGVGALQPNEQRTFTLAVEVFKPDAPGAPKRR